MKRIYLDIDPVLHRQMKLEALNQDITLKELIERRLTVEVKTDGKSKGKGKGKAKK